MVGRLQALLELGKAVSPGGDAEGTYICVSSWVIRQELRRRGLYTPRHKPAVGVAFFLVDPRHAGPAAEAAGFPRCCFPQPCRRQLGCEQQAVSSRGDVAEANGKAFCNVTETGKIWKKQNKMCILNFCVACVQSTQGNWEGGSSQYCNPKLHILWKRDGESLSSGFYKNFPAHLTLEKMLNEAEPTGSGRGDSLFLSFSLRAQ